MIVRIRLGSSLARLAPAPVLEIELPDGATVDDLYAGVARRAPELAPALASALPLVGGAHVERDRALAGGEEIALLTPVAGGCLDMALPISSADGCLDTALPAAGPIGGWMTNRKRATRGDRTS